MGAEAVPPVWREAPPRAGARKVFTIKDLKGDGINPGQTESGADSGRKTGFDRKIHLSRYELSTGRPGELNLLRKGQAARALFP